MVIVKKWFGKVYFYEDSGDQRFAHRSNGPATVDMDGFSSYRATPADDNLTILRNGSSHITTVARALDLVLIFIGQF